MVIDCLVQLEKRILKKDLMRMFAEALFDLKNYVPAADMGTDENDIQTIY